MWDAITSEALTKAIAYMATLAYVGAVTVAALARGPSGPAFWPLCVRVARLAAFVGVVALAARGWAHGAAVVGGAPDRDSLARVLLESRWGGRWSWQFAAAVAALAVAATRGLRRGAWSGPALVAAAWCVATPLLGHGASSTWQHVVHAAHVAVAGAWLGTVGVFAVATGPRARVPAEALAVLVGGFSPVALACAAAAAISGTVLAVTYVGTVADLTAAPYGRWLLLKLAAVALAGSCGFFNWRRVRSERPIAPLTLRAEAVAALLVAALTAVLSETEHPGL